jgi:predicted neuraminidase
MEAFQVITTKYADLFDEDKADRVWHETLEKIDKFLSDNGKRPGQTAKDLEEKHLGQWLVSNLTDSRKGKLVADRMEAF